MCLYVCMYADQCVCVYALCICICMCVCTLINACVYACMYAYQRRLQPEAHRRRGEVLLGIYPYQKLKSACASICVCRYADQLIRYAFFYYKKNLQRIVVEEKCFLVFALSP